MALFVIGDENDTCGIAAFVFCRKRLWGVCNTPLHGDGNGTRRVAAFVFYRKRLWGVCNTPLHGDENGTRQSAYIILSPTNPSCLFATSSFGVERDVCGVAGGLLGWKILNGGNVI